MSVLNLCVCVCLIQIHSFISHDSLIESRFPSFPSTILITFLRIAGYQSAATVKNLTSNKITDIEDSMRYFPILLKNYVDANTIGLTTTEECRIYNCFNDGGMLGNFEKISFRLGDKKLLLSISEYIKEKVKRRCYVEDIIQEDYTFFEFCNPNAKLPTISTTVGVFFGVEENYGTESTVSELISK